MPLRCFSERQPEPEQSFDGGRACACIRSAESRWLTFTKCVGHIDVIHLGSHLSNHLRMLGSCCSHRALVRREGCGAQLLLHQLQIALREHAHLGALRDITQRQWVIFLLISHEADERFVLFDGRQDVLEASVILACAQLYSTARNRALSSGQAVPLRRERRGVLHVCVEQMEVFAVLLPVLHAHSTIHTACLRFSLDGHEILDLK
mmetsp:Transcript_21529/g.46324  ORF Transcript_21529/g.46324 Transcript_21529/m.46324 type:complete len:206 (-) Transcript_21529:13-630(-)